MTQDDYKNQVLKTLQQHTQLLERIAIALEQQTQATNRSSGNVPRFNRDLADFPVFPWASIGASVSERDRHQLPSRVIWQGREYTRRAKQNEVWFSAKVGSVDGQPVYDRLIQFSKSAKPRSVPEEIREEWES